MLKENKISMRLDKWLWCARFYKTRMLALAAIKSGKIKQNGNRVKPSRSVKTGEELSLKKGPYTQTITIQSLSSHRQSAYDALNLYQETDESIKVRDRLLQQLKINNAQLPRSRGRPGKRDRRKLIEFTRHQDE